jgi:RNA polymerase sigma-B factor
MLHLRFYEGMTQSQIADRLGISQMHVSRLLTRSLGQLRQRLASADVDDYH